MSGYVRAKTCQFITYEISTQLIILLILFYDMSCFFLVYVFVFVIHISQNISELVWFGFMSYQPFEGYLIPNILYTYTLNIYDWLGWVLWNISHGRFLKAKSPLYIYIKWKLFGLFVFHDIQPL